jgi:predicted RNA-binding Zn-ribbon protein involved in translation (DUF1610 family)
MSLLTTHIQSKHQGIRYDCDQCDYRANTKSVLTIHQQSKHEGIRYDCDQCDYRATQQSHLTRHRQSQHEVVSSLTPHNEDHTEGVKYSSDLSLNTSSQSDLTKCIKQMEEISEEEEDVDVTDLSSKHLDNEEMEEDSLDGILGIDMDDEDIKEDNVLALATKT